MKPTGDRDPRAARDIRRLQRAVSQMPMSRILRDVEFTGGVTRRIPHGLGRRLEGYLIVGMREGSALGYWTDEHDARHSDLGTYAYIVANGMDCTADIMVF